MCQGKQELFGAVVQHERKEGQWWKQKEVKLERKKGLRSQQTPAEDTNKPKPEKRRLTIARRDWKLPSDITHYVAQLHCRHKNLCDQAARISKLLSVQYLHKERMCSNENISRIIQFESKDC